MILHLLLFFNLTFTAACSGFNTTTRNHAAHFGDFLNLTEKYTADTLKNQTQKGLIHDCCVYCSGKNIDIRSKNCTESTCKQCHCWDACDKYDDCCDFDVPTESPRSYECVLSNREHYFPGKYDGYYMKTTCPKNFKVPSSSEAFSGNDVSPVTSLTTNITYLNKYIAACHNDCSRVKWKKIKICPNSNISDFQNNKHCFFQIHPDEGIILRHCKDFYSADLEYVDSCNLPNVRNRTFQDKENEHNCKTRPYQPVVADESVFKNIFCFLCNSLSPYASACSKSSSSSTCINNLVRTKCPTCRPVCKKAQWYDRLKNECRYMICRQGFRLRDEECIMTPVTLPNIQFHVRRVFSISKKHTSDFRFQNWSYIEPLIVKNLQDSLNVFKNSDIVFTVYNIASEKRPSFGLHLVLRPKRSCCRDGFEHHLSEHFHNSWTLMNNDSQYIFISSEDNVRNYIYTDSQTYRIGALGTVPQKVNSYESLSKYIGRAEENIYLPVAYPRCPFIMFSADDFRWNSDKSITLKYAEIIIHPNVLIVYENNLFVCVDALEELYKHNHPTLGLVQQAENMVSLFFSILSLICLALTFVTYCTFPSLLTLPTKNTMWLVAFLFVAQLLLQFGGLASRNETSCKVIGVLIHYSWLCVIFWMNVCSYHMFHVFVIEADRPVYGYGNHNRLLRYVIYANGVPLIIVVLTVSANLGVTSGTDIGYGNGTCYLSTALLTGVSFVLPLGIILIMNIIFFSSSVWTMAKIRKMSITVGHDKSHVHIYMKLSTLTGIFWILSIVAENLHLNILVFISIILNASQGVFIFFSYLVNRRVYVLWKEKFSNNSGYVKSPTIESTRSTQF